MMSRAAASLGTNAMTFDQALVTPPWKSTASGMNELLGSGVGRGRAIPARLTGCGRFLMESEAARPTQGVSRTAVRCSGRWPGIWGPSLGTELPGYGSADNGWIAPYRAHKPDGQQRSAPQ